MFPGHFLASYLVALALLAVGCRGGEGVPVLRAPTLAAAAAPRPAWVPLAGDTLARIDDFIVAGDTLTVLDAAGHRIVHLRQLDGRWREVGSFARRGGGPGELQRPRALARARDTLVAVIEESGRIQLFRRDGRYAGTEREPLPCPMFAPVVAYGDADVRFVAGQCPGSGMSRDTVFTLLLRARGDAAYELLSKTPRMAIDFSWGSTFGTLRPLTVTGDAAYFGTGLEPCVERISLDGDERARQCALVRERFTAPEPAELERFRNAARRRGDERVAAASRWPEVLPAYLALVSEPGALRAVPLLVRPVSAESLAVHPPHAPFDPAAVRFVAPLQGFVGCTDGICLWYDRVQHRLALYRAGS